jgi:hypothetical protein
MSVAATGIYLVLGADPWTALALAVLTTWFIRFAEMWRD